MTVKMAFFLTMYIVLAAFAGGMMYIATPHTSKPADVVYIDTHKDQ